MPSLSRVGEALAPANAGAGRHCGGRVSRRLFSFKRSPPRSISTMTALFRFPNARRDDPAVTQWMNDHWDALGDIARRWIEVIRACGDDVHVLLHDGRPTLCVGDAAFAYVDVYRAHVNVGFFRGAALADPAGLMEGEGKSMRHVKLTLKRDVDERALTTLIRAAYRDMKGHHARSA